ncbi:MAG: Bro-N domain-containing protein [Saprospiraceae bacterium]|nr:Bro-N domain-containing protein [Saprospiraceae bacterium]
MEKSNKILIFQQKQIRRIWQNDEWWYSVTDVVEVLTGTNRARKYWSDLKKKLYTEGYAELSENIGQLKVPATDGKSYKIDVATVKTLLRLIMSIPSPKVEPFKQWLAQIGQERIEEIENPELLSERQSEMYRAKGYPEDWIAQRIQTIDTRKELTDEWKKRGIQESIEFSILTAEIAKATFGLTPSEHKNLKGLTNPSHNLRDHMTRIELIFTALSEETTRSLAVEADAQGFAENHDIARRGGEMAGRTRENYEKLRGIKVVSTENFLNQIDKNDGNPALSDES